MKPPQIIIVDDESYICSMLALQLTKAGYEARSANDGEQAFELAINSTPRLIISDYQMPVLSGLDLAVRLREDSRTSQVPILMLTARGHQITPEQLARTNIRCIVAKPFSARDLIKKVSELLAAALPGDAASDANRHRRVA